MEGTRCELSDKEIRIIMYVASGLKNREIAPIFNTSSNYVREMISRIFDKLGFHNRVELALWYVKNFEFGYYQVSLVSCRQESSNQAIQRLKGD